MGKKSRNIGLLIFTYILLAVMFVILFFDSMVITVPSGHIGVFYSRFIGGTDLKHTYGEGLHLIFPWDEMYIYDCRSQKEDYNVVVLVEGGLRVVVHSSIVWRVIPDFAPVLHVSAGQDYRNILIAPAMTSAIRTSAGLQPDLYSRAFNAYTFEEDILSYVQNFLNKGTFVFEAVLMREIELPERMLSAINDKFAAEQMVLQQRYHVQEAYERFKQQFIDAESLRNAALIVNSGLTENFLRYQGIEATRKLAESNNAKLVIIGDKDGLPLILNPESLSAGQPGVQPPAAAPLSDSTVTPELELNNLGGFFGQLDERLNSIDPMPQFESATLPQTSGIQRE
jgi:regulator of protease activity HflC (stomatin/prohibitin superfamily)